MPSVFVATEADLEERLSRPTSASMRAMYELGDGLLILGIGGKMGPSLARLARRSAQEVGLPDLRIVGVARFSTSGLREELERSGIETIACDLLDETARRQLPRFRNVLFMLGHKFSKGDYPGTHWAMNTYLSGLLAEQYRESRIVCFSSGNVYPFTPTGSPAPTETSACGPVGEYAATAWGRERMVEYMSARYRTPACLLRLNYAVELRYGVLIDIAQQLLAGTPIDLGVPNVNFVWQGYANRVALQAFSLCHCPAAILNLTGSGSHRVRALATGLAARLGLEAQFAGEEGPASLLNDSSRCHELFGLPELEVEELLDLTAAWIKSGGTIWGKPTKFQVRDGKF